MDRRATLFRAVIVMLVAVPIRSSGAMAQAATPGPALQLVRHQIDSVNALYIKAFGDAE